MAPASSSRSHSRGSGCPGRGLPVHLCPRSPPDSERGCGGSFLPGTWSSSECGRPPATLPARPLPPRATQSWGSVPPHGRRGPGPARPEVPSACGRPGWMEPVQGPSSKSQWFRVLQVEMRRLLKFRRSRSKPSSSECERVWGRGSCGCSVLRWGQNAAAASTSPLAVLLKQEGFEAGTHTGTLRAGSFHKPRKAEAERMKPPTQLDLELRPPGRWYL